MKIQLFFAIAIFCAVVLSPARTTPIVNVADEDVKVEERQLLPFEIDKSRLFSDEKLCPCFLRTTFGGRVEPSLSFRFPEGDSHKQLKIETVPLKKITVILDEAKDVPTAVKTQDEDGNFVWIIRISRKAYDLSADCLPKPSLKQKEEKK